MLDAVWTKCHDYYDEIPQDTFQSIGRSTLISFTATFVLMNTGLLFVRNFEGSVEIARPAAAALIAGTATIINALATPLFNAIFGDREVKFEREIIKLMFNMTCTYLVLNPITALKTSPSLAVVIFQRIFPVNVFKATFDVLPRFLDWTGDPGMALQFRQFFHFLGLGIYKDSNSAHYAIIVP